MLRDFLWVTELRFDVMNVLFYTWETPSRGLREKRGRQGSL